MFSNHVFFIMALANLTNNTTFPGSQKEGFMDVSSSPSVGQVHVAVSVTHVDKLSFGPSLNQTPAA